MGYWSHARTGGGPWRRVWVTDTEENQHKEADKVLEKMITDAHIIEAQKRFADKRFAIKKGKKK